MNHEFDPVYVFSHHEPTPEKIAHYDAIHVAALRLLRESTMMANAAIALEGRLTAK